MAKRKSKGGKAKVSVSAAPEVEAVAIILMNAVVAAIDDFESDQSFLVGMGSVGEDEIPEGGMEKWSYTEKSAAGLRSEVHYVRDPKTGQLMDFKFNHHAETYK